MRDVTTPEQIADSTVAHYRSQGFVRIRQIISSEEAAAFHRAASAALERLRHKDYSRSSVFTQIVNVWQEDAAMRELTLHPNVGAVAERLAGIPLRIWHDHMLIKQPHNNAPTEFHQDQPFWPHANTRHTLSAWIALVDVPVERGCMTFIPESHTRADLRPQNLHDAHDLFSIWPDLAWRERVTIPLKAGDCTFHHGLCPHMATPNNTDEARFAHVVIFMDAETTYSGAKHVITDPLGLQVGDRLDGPLFPRTAV
jgi:ectoine hydroxylase-related dioxygenase (phytanoyl-CoA dioxygenase family)